jgi:hypothetical protein
LLVVGEDSDEGVGRKATDVFEVVLGDGDAIPEPVEENG